jgi:hypothetical protein
MLAATQPERDRAAGMLYLTGPEGSGKSTAADKITEAAGSSVARKTLDARRGDDRDLLVGASASWVLGLDNLSSLTADQQDLVCTVITGREETYRVLYSTTDTVTLTIRRPVIATSIEIPILRPDLISRMVPVDLDPLRRITPEDELAERWMATLPSVFGGLLSLLAQVMAAPREDLVDLPRLAVLGRMAAAADLIRDTDTLSRLAHSQGHLLGDTVTDDPFFDGLRAAITTGWTGRAPALLAKLDPDGEMARRHGKQWPTARGVTHRLKRYRRPLETEGWTLTVEHTPGDHGQVWTITPPRRAGGGVSR